MKPESDNLSDYLLPTHTIDSEHPSIRGQAEEIIGELADELEQGKALFEWVRDTIPHSYDIQTRRVTCKASQVLAEGTGICYAKSHLLAAMSRAVGIPAGLCYQQFRRVPEYGGYGLHGLNAIYLASEAQWVTVDPRGNKPGVEAQFSLAGDGLAFPPDPEKGEFLYETIFVDADPAVVDFLEMSDDLLESWPDLPASVRLPTQA